MRKGVFSEEKDKAILENYEKIGSDYPIRKIYVNLVEELYLVFMEFDTTFNSGALRECVFAEKKVKNMLGKETYTRVYFKDENPRVEDNRVIYLGN